MAATARSFRISEEAMPIAEINTTPLVDVMLVLLIMFILIIPVSSHKVPLDLPTNGEGALPQTHRLDLDQAGRLFWDGGAIAPAALTARLRALAADPRDPVLEINAHSETRYERFDETLAAVRRAGVGRIAFVGQSRFAGALEGAR